MTDSHYNHKRFSLTALLFLVLSSAAEACPVCFTAPESPETKAMTLAILFLLATIGLVICGVGSFFVYLMTQKKNPTAAHQELEHLTFDNPSSAH